MELLVLGSGTCAVTFKQNAAGYLIKAGKTKILLDCGSGIIRQIVKAGEDYKDIDIVVLSHFHPDHASDLVFLIQAIENTPLFKRKKPLYVLGPKGVKDFVSNLLLLFDLGSLESRKYGLKVYGLDKKRSILRVNFEGKKGNHSQHSVIVKLKSKGKTLVYSADTDWDPEIADFSKNIDFLILEASWSSQYKDKKEIRGKHLTPQMAVKLAKMAKARKLLLTHFYPVFSEKQIKKETENSKFKGEILIAADFLKFVI